jgi:protein-S-isoprenylcysteine O-methyltransferase Ste14
MSSNVSPKHEPIALSGTRVALGVLVTLLVLWLSLFAPAGHLAWREGWIFLAVFVVAGTLGALYLWRVNPEIYVARSRIHEGTKRWDVVVVSFLMMAMVAVLVVASLDDGRFHWFPVQRWVRMVGYGLVLVGIALATWAEAVNKFFEPGVRIQKDRGHTVIDTGPYAFIRHPGYCAGHIIIWGTPLALGSLWALIPAGACTGILILRTVWEDQTLQAELPGYKQYAARVRYKMIPGVW